LFNTLGLLLASVCDHCQCPSSRECSLWGQCSGLCHIKQQCRSALAVTGIFICHLYHVFGIFMHSKWDILYCNANIDLWLLFLCCNPFLLFSRSSQLLGIPSNMLQEGLTHRKIEAKAEEVMKEW